MSEKHNPISFESYEKIVDDVYYLGIAVLRFHVTLARKDKDTGFRRHFHNEYRYESKYPNYEYVSTIRRLFNYYLTIEIPGDFSSSIMITPKDMLVFQTRMQEMIGWFGNLFKTNKDGDLVIMGNWSPIIIDHISGGKYIRFDPTIIVYDNGVSREGIRMMLGDSEKYADLNIDCFMGFVYTMNNFNMYLAATSVLAYMQPAFGNNSITMGGGNNFKGTKVYGAAEQEVSNAPTNTKKLKSQNKSYFDRLDDL